MMKAKILLHKNLDQGGIQALDEKSQTYSEVIDGLKIFKYYLMIGNINTICNIYDGYMSNMSGIS